MTSMDGIFDRIEVSRGGPRGMGNYFIEDPATGKSKEVKPSVGLSTQRHVHHAKMEIVQEVLEEKHD